MNECSQRILRSVDQNDRSTTTLSIGCRDGFNSSSGSDFSALGTSIGENTHLTTLVVTLRDDNALDGENNEFNDGLKRNSSIHDLRLGCRNHSIVGGVVEEILMAYQENNRHLRSLRINYALIYKTVEEMLLPQH